jgi:ABC-2 type transport system permease protein
LVAVLVTSAVITAIDGRVDLSFIDAAYVRHSVESFLRLLLAISPYVGLAVLFSILGGSPTAGIALSVGVAFLEGFVGGMMTLAGGWVAELPKYMLDMNADTLALEAGGAFGTLFGADGGSPFFAAFDRPSPLHAALVLTAWALAFFTLAFWFFQRQDLEYQG